MREINKVNLESKQIKSGVTVRLTLLIDDLLLSKARNVVNAQRTQTNTTYNNVSSLIRQALEQYQQGKLKLTNYESKQKQEISVRFPSPLYAYYQSLSKGQRSSIINSSLNTFLNTLP